MVGAPLVAGPIPISEAMLWQALGIATERPAEMSIRVRDSK